MFKKLTGFRRRTRNAPHTFFAKTESKGTNNAEKALCEIKSSLAEIDTKVAYKTCLCAYTNACDCKCKKLLNNLDEAV